MPVGVLRRVLGVSEDDLVDKLEPIDWKELEGREKGRLRRLYECSNR